MDDLISRQSAIDALKEHRNLFCDNTPDTFSVLPYGDKCRVDELDMAIATLINLPSAQPEQLTDKEQRIFLAAMGREEKVCKQVDDECRNCREPYEDSLVRTCHEITRKVKGALWMI